ALLDQIHGRLGIVVHHEGAHSIEHMIGLRAAHKKTAIRQRTLITRRYSQILHPRPTVGTWTADVDDPAEPHVIERAELHRRHFHHHRALSEIDDGEIINGIGVGGKKERVSVHQLGKDDDGVVLSSYAVE